MVQGGGGHLGAILQDLEPLLELCLLQLQVALHDVVQKVLQVLLRLCHIEGVHWPVWLRHLLLFQPVFAPQLGNVSSMALLMLTWVAVIASSIPSSWSCKNLAIAVPGGQLVLLWRFQKLKMADVKLNENKICPGNDEDDNDENEMITLWASPSQEVSITLATPLSYKAVSTPLKPRPPTLLIPAWVEFGGFKDHQPL